MFSSAGTFQLHEMERVTVNSNLVSRIYQEVLGGTFDLCGYVALKSPLRTLQNQGFIWRKTPTAQGASSI